LLIGSFEPLLRGGPVADRFRWAAGFLVCRPYSSASDRRDSLYWKTPRHRVHRDCTPDRCWCAGVKTTGGTWVRLSRRAYPYVVLGRNGLNYNFTDL